MVLVKETDVDEILTEITKDADIRRTKDDGTRPYFAMNLIRQYRLGAIQLPIEQGGRGYNIRQLFQFVVRLAEADSDVAHILRAHYGYVEHLLRENIKGKNNELLSKIADGIIIGNAITEQSSKNVGNLTYNTRLTLDKEGYRLNGVKYFSTGTLYSDYVVVSALDISNEPIAVIIPTNREGIIIEDDWDGIGQKLSGSGTTKFENVLVKHNEIFKNLDGKEKTPFNAFPQLYLQAIIVGILKNVVTDCVKLIKGRKRTFSFATSNIPSEDVQLLQIIGELSSTVFAAEAMLVDAADALNKAVINANEGNILYDLSHEASLKVAQTKVIIDQIALQAATIIFDVGGASATKQLAMLDRHWRNIRTLVSHNPTVYKARAIGDYIVNEKYLPIREVYF